VTKPEEIEPAMRDALAQKCPTIVNIMIDTAVHDTYHQRNAEMSHCDHLLLC
jgi:thiamine pyrophosphate-dependent acetolactate synthase large subunit-like protein